MQQQSYRIEPPLLAGPDTEARQLGHHWIGPEHLLRSFAAKPGRVSRAFFERHQLSRQSLLESVAAVVGPSIRAVRDEQPLTISRRAHLALAHALGGSREGSARRTGRTDRRPGRVNPERPADVRPRRPAQRREPDGAGRLKSRIG